MTPVRNIYAPVGIDAHNYLGQRRRVRNGILDEVPDRVLDGVRVPFHHHRLVGVDESKRAISSYRPRRHCRNWKCGFCGVKNAV